MKKIGILSYHFADNYGAVLQCFALQEFFSKNLKLIAKVVNYEPESMLTLKSKLKRFFLPTKLNLHFKDFRSKYFNYDGTKSFYDFIIVGSDQVWNPLINYFDNFWISPRIKYNKIISYAASLGKENLSDKESKYFTNNIDNLRKYSLVSLREKRNIVFFRSIGINAHFVVDPTLLHYENTSLYESLLNKSQIKIKNRYGLVYSLEKSLEIDELVKHYREKYKIEIYSIHPMNEFYHSFTTPLRNCSVSDFLFLFKNAEFVITNSYHGLIFSIIFRKVVVNVNHSSLATRQTDLIESSGFSIVIVRENVFQIDTNENNIDLINLIKKSKTILQKIIS